MLIPPNMVVKIAVPITNKIERMMMADMGTVDTVREYLKANKNRIPYHCKHTLSHSWLLKV